MSIFKIVHYYAKDMERDAQYVESELQQPQVADLVVGLQFFLEDNCSNTDNFNEEMASYLLCNFFGCKKVDKAAWTRFSQSLDEDEIAEEWYYVDLFCDREERCGPDYKQYQAPIENLKDTKFIKALCAFFNSEESSHASPPVEELLAKYTEEN